MLGHRGCRLGVTYPEIYEMQARAIFEAALDVAEQGDAPVPEVMIPLVTTKRELDLMKAVVDQAAKDVFAERGASVDYLVGTMIELPRAALRAGDIAESAEFFSFGTNDLTQTTLGVSRDDAARFLGAYVEQGIYAKGPVRQPGRRGRRRAGEPRRRARAGDAARHQAGHLRRAWRRPGQHRLLRVGGPRLRQRLALSRADRAAGGGAVGGQAAGGRQGLTDPVAAIVFYLARADNGVIGEEGALPWHLPADFRRFKAMTMGKPIVMGRVTQDSFPRPLPGRRNIVLTRDRGWSRAGVEVAHDPAAALALAGDVPEVAVIGGAEVFALYLDRAVRVELTEVHCTPAGGPSVPAFTDDWRETAREAHPAADGQPAYDFVTLVRA